MKVKEAIEAGLIRTRTGAWYDPAYLAREGLVRRELLRAEDFNRVLDKLERPEPELGPPDDEDDPELDEQLRERFARA